MQVRNGIWMALAIIFAIGSYPAVGDDVRDLKAELSRLQARVEHQDAQIATLRADQTGDWMNEKQAEQVKTLIREVLSDADTRASLLEDGMTAGWDNGFFLRSADNSFKLRLLGKVQVQYVLNLQDESPTDDQVGGFQLRRTEFGFLGHVQDPSLQYFLYFYQGPSGSVSVLDAWMRKKFNAQHALKAGQFKSPFWKEWMMSSSRQQMVDRSLISSEFSGTFTQGIQYEYTGDTVRGYVSLNDGADARNTAWNTEGLEGLGVTGRAEVKLAGDWKQASDFQAWVGEDTLVVLGAAGHYQQGNYGTATDETQTIRWTVDAQSEFSGLSLYAAVIGDHTSGGAAGSVDSYGAIAQAGYFVTDSVELFGRYEWGDSGVAGEEDLSLATVGFNKFFNGHAFKWSTDVGYAFNGVSATWASSSTGWREDAAGESGQVVVRSQVQLMW